MTSGTNELHDLIGFVGTTRNPRIVLVVAFDYYDGPERGLAIYASGKGVRFSYLGESKSRMFRAFKVTAIAGNWRKLVDKNITTDEYNCKILVASDSNHNLVELEQEVIHAPAQGEFVGVGQPNLEILELCAVSPEQLGMIENETSCYGSFNLTHKIIKAARKEKQ